MFMFRSRWTGPRPPDAADVAAPLCFRCYLLILASPLSEISLFDGLSWNTVIVFPSATPVLSVKLILARNCFNWPPWDLKLKLQSNHRSQGSTLVKALRGKYKNYLLIYTVRHFSFFFLQANSEIMKPVRLVECSQHSCVGVRWVHLFILLQHHRINLQKTFFKLALRKVDFSERQEHVDACCHDCCLGFMLRRVVRLRSTSSFSV